MLFFFFFFFFNDTATTEIYTLSLHDALPISPPRPAGVPSQPTSSRERSSTPSCWRTAGSSPPTRCSRSPRPPSPTPQGSSAPTASASRSRPSRPHDHAGVAPSRARAFSSGMGDALAATEQIWHNFVQQIGGGRMSVTSEYDRAEQVVADVAL